MKKSLLPVLLLLALSFLLMGCPKKDMGGKVEEMKEKGKEKMEKAKEKVGILEAGGIFIRIA